MASIEIPENEIPKLEKIVAISEDAFTSLVKAFKTTEPSLNFKKYSANLVKSTSGLKEEELLQIVGVVLSLCSSKDSSGSDSDTVVALTIEFLSKAYPSRFSKEKILLLQKRLKDLFESGNVGILTSKSMNILTGHQHVFLGARIFSDLRPVFGDVIESVQAAVIVHNLKITYREGTETKEFFVALDNNDIETFKKNIERAENKTKAIVSLLNKSQVTYLDVK